MSKFSMADIKKLVELLEAAKEVRPVLTLATNVLIDEVGPELGRLAEQFRQFRVKNVLMDIQDYQNGGCSREEAVLLAMDARAVREELLETFGSNRANKAKSE